MDIPLRREATRDGSIKLKGEASTNTNLKKGASTQGEGELEDYKSPIKDEVARNSPTKEEFVTPKSKGYSFATSSPKEGEAERIMVKINPLKLNFSQDTIADKNYPEDGEGFMETS